MLTLLASGATLIIIDRGANGEIQNVTVTELAELDTGGHTPQHYACAAVGVHVPPGCDPYLRERGGHTPLQVSGELQESGGHLSVQQACLPESGSLPGCHEALAALEGLSREHARLVEHTCRGHHLTSPTLTPQCLNVLMALGGHTRAGQDLPRARRQATKVIILNRDMGGHHHTPEHAACRSSVAQGLSVGSDCAIHVQDLVAMQGTSTPQEVCQVLANEGRPITQMCAINLQQVLSVFQAMVPLSGMQIISGSVSIGTSGAPYSR